MVASGMTYGELWLRRLAVGGEASEVEAHLHERFVDEGDNHPMGYQDPASS